jgi:glycerol-3-phosphate cytidylyltransferase-like family protein
MCKVGIIGSSYSVGSHLSKDKIKIAEPFTKWLEKYNPDIMIVGSDWIGKKVIGSQYAKTIRFFNRIGHYSTTNIVEGSSYR